GPKLELDSAQDAPVAVSLLEPVGANHVATVLRSHAPPIPPSKGVMSGTVPNMSAGDRGLRHKSVTLVPHRNRARPSGLRSGAWRAYRGPSSRTRGSSTSAR